MQRLTRSTKDVNDAVNDAKNAFEEWSTNHLQRARIMFKFKELIEKFDELTKIIVSEHGKSTMMLKDR